LGRGVSVQYKIFVDYFGKKVYKNLENKLGSQKTLEDIYKKKSTWKYS
jgi:hypothetical protein